MGEPARRLLLGSAVQRALAAASLGAGLIHVSAAFDHTEHPAQVAFFVTVAILQVGWAAALFRLASWRLLAGGAALNAAVVLVWVVSRTAGVPGVPGAEEAEPLGFKDGVSSALELALVAAAAGLLYPAAARRLRLVSGPIGSWAAVAAIAVLTAAAVTVPGHQDEQGHGHERAELAGSGQDHGDAGHDAEAGAVTAPERDHLGVGHNQGSEELAAPGHHRDDPGHSTESASPFASAHLHTPGHSSHAMATGPQHQHGDGHHHVPGQEHGPGHDHGDGAGVPSPGEEAGHDHGAAPAPGHDHDQDDDQAAGPGHDHGEGGGPDHGGDHDQCAGKHPEHPALTQVQEAARALGLGCLATQ